MPVRVFMGVCAGQDARAPQSTCKNKTSSVSLLSEGDPTVQMMAKEVGGPRRSREDEQEDLP